VEMGVAVRMALMKYLADPKAVAARIEEERR
jgi:hypothetical protein